MKCPNCGKDNMSGTPYCEECGTKLEAPAQQVAAPQQPGPVVSQPPGPAAPQPIPTPPPVAVAPQPVFVTTPPGPVTPTPSTAGAKLVLMSGAMPVQEFPINQPTIQIGRVDMSANPPITPDIDLSGYDPQGYVSRRHAQITMQGGQYTITDTKSTNKTWVGGVVLAPNTPYPLSNNTQVRMAHLTFTFMAGAPVQAYTPPQGLPSQPPQPSQPPPVSVPTPAPVQPPQPPAGIPVTPQVQQPPAGVPISPPVQPSQPPAGIPIPPQVQQPQPPAGVPIPPQVQPSPPPAQAPIPPQAQQPQPPPQVPPAQPAADAGGKKCSNCGTENPANAKFCDNCGSKL